MSTIQDKIQEGREGKRFKGRQRDSQFSPSACHIIIPSRSLIQISFANSQTSMTFPMAHTEHKSVTGQKNMRGMSDALSVWEDFSPKFVCAE